MHSSAVCDGPWNTVASDSDQQDEEGALQVRQVTHTRLLVRKRKRIRPRNYWTHTHTRWQLLCCIWEEESWVLVVYEPERDRWGWPCQFTHTKTCKSCTVSHRLWGNQTSSNCPMHDWVTSAHSCLIDTNFLIKHNLLSHDAKLCCLIFHSFFFFYYFLNPQHTLLLA